eukprot:896318-Pleurochrysis_carterae.AAC.1
MEEDVAYVLALADSSPDDEIFDDDEFHGLSEPFGLWPKRHVPFHHRYPQNGSLEPDATPGKTFSSESHKLLWWRLLNDHA